MIDYFKKKKISDRAEDEALYEYVMEEMSKKSGLIKGIWAKAVAHSDGDDKKAKSLYMQYRVQSIKDEFETLKIAYNDLSKEQLFKEIKSGFKGLIEKVKKREKVKTLEEVEKYKKIGGVLYFFGVLLIIGIIGAIVNISYYYGSEFEDLMQNLYLHQVDSSITSSLRQLVYIPITITVFLGVFAFAFFNKYHQTQALGISFFSINLLVAPYLYYLVTTVGNDEILYSMQVTTIGGSFWSLVFLIYFIFSKRVKRTFNAEALPGRTTGIILTALYILLASISSFNQNIDKISSEYSLGYEAKILGDENFDNENFQEATEWYYKAVNWGVTSSKFRLAYSYNKINRPTLAIKYYLEYINYSEFEGAMRNLAIVYRVERNTDEAEKWFKKAFDIYLEKSNNGDKEAMKWLEVMYRSGEGVERDINAADEWKNRLETAEEN